MAKVGSKSVHFHITVHHQRTSGQELKLGSDLEAGADAEVMGKCCLLAFLVHRAGCLK